MTDVQKNQPESQKLTDEELGEVTGGYGAWDVDLESSARNSFNHSREGYGDLNAFIIAHYGEDSLTARNAWVAGGSPSNLVFYCADDGSISSKARGGIGKG